MERLEEYKKRRPSWRARHPELASRTVKRKKKGKKASFHRKRKSKSRKTKDMCSAMMALVGEVDPDDAGGEAAGDPGDAGGEAGEEASEDHFSDCSL